MSADTGASPEPNPYRAPRSTDSDSPGTGRFRRPNVLARSGVGMLLGATAGITAGATAGALTAMIHAVIALAQASSAVLQVDVDAFVMTLVLAAAFAGVLGGGIAGGALGLVTGLLTALVPALPGRSVIRFSAASHALAGCLLGGLLSHRLYHFGLIPWPWVAWPTGILIGAAAASASGLLVGRSLVRLAARPRRRQN